MKTKGFWTLIASCMCFFSTSITSVFYAQPRTDDYPALNHCNPNNLRMIYHVSSEAAPRGHWIIGQLKAAAQTWNNALGWEKITIVTTAALNHPFNAGNVDSRQLNTLLSDSRTDIVFANPWFSFKDRGIIATAPSAIRGNVYDADLYLNLNKYWFGNARIHQSPNNKPMIDLQTIVLHAMGHNLCLGHTINPKSVMYPWIEAGEIKRRLTQTDLLELCAVYPDSIVCY